MYVLRTACDESFFFHFLMEKVCKCRTVFDLTPPPGEERAETREDREEQSLSCPFAPGGRGGSTC